MVVAILPCDCDGDSPPVAPSSAGGSGGGGGGGPLIQQTCNASYMRMIKSIGDLQGDVVRYRAIQILLICACAFLCVSLCLLLVMHDARVLCVCV